MRKSLWVVLAIMVALAGPRVCYAREIDFLESFTNGFETLKGNDVSEEVNPESDYIRDYEPQDVRLDVPSNRTLPEDATTTDYVNNTVDAFNRVSWSVGNTTNNMTILGFLQNFLGISPGLMRTLIITTPIGIVFMWWGVRKSKSIIMAAFRTGRLNLGTSVKRAWYRRKAKEWYG